MSAITLNSQSLSSKYGFSDGDLLSDYLFDHGVKNPYRTRFDGLSFDHIVLCELVERYLLPRIPRCPSTERIGTHHNPIRLVDTDIEVPDISVSVDFPVVMALIAELEGK